MLRLHSIAMNRNSALRDGQCHNGMGDDERERERDGVEDGMEVCGVAGG